MSASHLTERQIDIITYLLSKKEWITSEELSIYFDINRKTIQNEVKSMIAILSEECLILTNQHKGYFLEHLSGKAKSEISEDIRYFGGKNSLRLRASTFVLYLFFNENYVSMQKLADVFYLSKTAISLELENIKRWAERSDALRLEISRTKGIKINVSELQKRIYCAKFGTINAFRSMALSTDIADQYEVYIDMIKDILKPIFIDKEFIVTGEEYDKNVRFISICILRSELGYLRTSLQEEKLEPSFKNFDLTMTIAKSITENIGHVFNKEELKDIDMILDESSLLYSKSTVSEEISEKLKRLDENIRKILNLEDRDLFENKEIIGEHLYKMEQRTRTGNVALNHYNEEIVLRYPLEVHLMYRLLPGYFNLKVTKELSFMSIFLATSLNVYRNKLSVLLISNQNMSIIHQIQEIIRSNNACNISEFKVLPTYIFESNQEILFNYDVLLTTEREILFINKQFFFLNSILTKQDIKNISSLFNKKIEEVFTVIKNEICEKYLIEKPIDEQEKFFNIKEIIGDCDEEKLSYHTFDKDKLYICTVNFNVKTSIEIYTASIPISFLHKKIKKIIFVKFNQNQSNIIDFFRVISEILNEI